MSNVPLYNYADKDAQKCSAGIHKPITSMRSTFKQCHRKKLDGSEFCGTHKRASEYEPPKRSSVYSARGILQEVLRDVILPPELSKRIEQELRRKPAH